MNWLDPLGRKLIKEIIKELKSKDKTIFFSSHILSDVEEIADKFSIIHNGRTIFTQNIKDLEDKLENESINWFDYAYIYFIDEFQMFTGEGYSRADYHLLVEQFLHLINSSAPDLRIMTTTPPSQELESIREYIDIYCPITSDYNEVEWSQAQQDGKEMWMYPCVGLQAPWPNSHLYNRLFEIRVLLWQTYYYNIDGFLYWSANAYFHGNYGMAYNGWGDGWFLYTDDNGKIDPSIRWEAYRDGIEDYEYLYIINATLNEISGTPEDFSRLKKLVSTVTTDRYNYCESGYVVKNSRDKIGEWISTLASTNPINITAIAETPLF